jgi:hypothetical protein
MTMNDPLGDGKVSQKLHTVGTLERTNRPKAEKELRTSQRK